jgi:cullin 1
MSGSSNDTNDALVELEKGVQRIMSYPPETLELRTYVRLYTLIHNFCVGKKITGQKPPQHRDAHLLGEELYIWLDGYISRHLLELHNNMVSQPDNALTTFYLEQWRCYKAAAASNAHLFRFLDRHWVKREVDEGKHPVHHIYPLHLVRWKENILENTQNPVKALLQQHIERAEESWIVVSPNVPEVLESFAAVGISVDSLG